MKEEPGMDGRDGATVVAAGEVIAVTTTSFEAQSYVLNDAPPFGSLVTTRGPDGRTHFALCSGTATGGIEPGRHAMAWGSGSEGDADIYARQPQLSHVLRTTFSCVLVGYLDASGSVLQRVPPRPPRVHERVWMADDGTARRFYEDLAYLRFLLRAGVETVEDLMAASIGHAYHLFDCDRAFLMRAGKVVARLLAGDHDRLMSVLELLSGEEENLL
jgi:hypothetical protein